jgi:polysaccharide pyruvyl transferase WcaK-like protein
MCCGVEQEKTVQQEKWARLRCCCANGKVETRWKWAVRYLKPVRSESNSVTDLIARQVSLPVQEWKVKSERLEVASKTRKCAVVSRMHSLLIALWRSFADCLQYVENQLTPLWTNFANTIFHFLVNDNLPGGY